MVIETYHDGIAFYTYDKEYEIAFYSNITDRISYNERNGYKDWTSIGCVCIPYEDNRFIIDEVRRYKRSLECGIWQLENICVNGKMNMNPIELQECDSKSAFGGLHPKNMRQAFEIYEMIIEDYNCRQSKLIDKEFKEYINKNYVDAKDIALGDEL